MEVRENRKKRHDKNFKGKKKKGNNRPVEKTKRQLEDEEISSLKEKYLSHDPSSVETFNDFPLSSRTLRGLTTNDYTVPTEIQRECIGLVLKGNDVLGAAKTGSGKTLAFLVPVLEILFCNKWSQLDGLGALIITPTRELALQIYETLCRIGKYHDFSAGLIIGGKDLQFEKSRMHQVNIIICTPGRLLQHMDENPLFDCANLQILVLDEADRCLDLGFEECMNSIIENLPKSRRTLLFSATQTRSVKDLIRLSLKDPKYISVHENAKHKTPEGLTQSFIVCEQHEKMPMLWSFIKTHLRQKIIVFMSTCHQVKYIYDILCKLHPRITMLALHGKLHQLKRMDVYHTFCRKQHAVLFATDIAARGLDFPEVNWVIQLDCPEDVATYIHRAGRTARYQKGGECLLVVRPPELKIIEYLESGKIPISEIKVNPSRLFSPQAKIEAYLAKDPNLKASAQRAFVSYAKSVFLMKDKTIFDVRSIDTDKFARSLGLVVSPRIRFLQRIDKEKKKALTAGEEEMNIKEDMNVEPNDDESLPEIPTTSKHNKEMDVFNFHANDSGSEEDVLVVKRKHNFEEEEEVELKPLEPRKKKSKVLTKVALAKRALKKKIIPNKKILFTEEGEAMMNKMRERVTEIGKSYESKDTEGGINIEEAKEVMKEEDIWDRKLFREVVKAKKREKKRKLKELRRIKAGLPPREENEEPGEDSAEDSGPDLSWLPDPDKIYGKTKSSDNEQSSDDDVQPNKAQKDEFSSGSDYEDNDGMTIKEQEELALKLLSSN